MRQDMVVDRETALRLVRGEDLRNRDVCRAYLRVTDNDDHDRIFGFVVHMCCPLHEDSRKPKGFESILVEHRVN
jgi:hypothetical protein